MNARDVRVVQGRQQLRFSLEPRDALLVGGELFRQHFDRNVTIELGVAGFVDLAHAARTDGSFDHNKGRGWCRVRETLVRHPLLELFDPSSGRR